MTVLTSASVYREFVTTGSTVRHKPITTEIRELLGRVEAGGPCIATDLASITRDTTQTAIRTVGHATPGDGGGALWKHVASEPAHSAKYAALGGGWWELSEAVVTPQMFGGFPSLHASPVDITAAINAAYDYFRKRGDAGDGREHHGGEVHFPLPAAGKFYAHSGQIDVRDLANVRTTGRGSSSVGVLYAHPATAVVYTGTASAGWLFNFPNDTVGGCGSIGLIFSDLFIGYSSASFTGDLMSVRAFAITWIDCHLGHYSFDPTPNFSAASLVRLRHSHSHKFIRCGFSQATVGIWLKNDVGDTGSANHTNLTDCQFYDCLIGYHADTAASGGKIHGCKFNPILLRSGITNTRAIAGFKGTLVGADISGGQFAPTDGSLGGFTEGAIVLVGGTMSVSGSTIVNPLGAGLVVRGGTHTVSGGVSITAGVPIKVENGNLAATQPQVSAQPNTDGVYSFFSRSRYFAVGEIIAPASPGALLFECTVAGTTGASAPTWPTLASAADTNTTVTDGGVTWRAIAFCGIGIATTGFNGAFSVSLIKPDLFNGGTTANWLVFVRGSDGPSSSWKVDITYDAELDLSTNGIKGGGYCNITNIDTTPIMVTANRTLTAKEVGRLFVLSPTATANVTFTLPDSTRDLHYSFLQRNTTYSLIVSRTGATDTLFKPGAGAVNTMTASGATGSLGSTLALRGELNVNSGAQYWQVERMIGTWT